MTAIAAIGLCMTTSGAAYPQPAADSAPDSFSGAVSERSPDSVGGNTVSGSQGLIEVRVRSETCPAVHRAIRFYTSRLRYWRGKMGAGDVRRRETSVRSFRAACPRYLAHVLKRKSYAARMAYGRWHTYQYAWQAWLPDKWQRIGACETGYGRRPGNWRHSNSSYEGAFGFAVGSWDAFTPYADRKAGPYPRNAYLATPRQQYEVALAIYRRYGLSGWGCRNS